MIPTQPFGATGHHSTRVLFGAAALGAMRQEKADAILDLLLEFGINHIDTAASYGDSELRIAPWMKQHRQDFFLATKTGERTYQGARDSLHRSLERLGVDQVDLIQMHNLSDPGDWDVAMGDDGALQALVEAQDAGLARFIGVTGHGTYVPSMHIKSLEAHPFASVLLPYNFSMMRSPQYASDFNELYVTCTANAVAMQAIKTIARRRWREDADEKRFSWYQPIKDDDALRRAVHYALAKSGLFLNTSSDTTLLRRTLEIASEPIEAPTDAQMQEDSARLGMEPLFVRDVSDAV